MARLSLPRAATEAAGDGDGTAGPHVGVPLMTVPFLLGLGFLFLDPIQNRTNFFRFLSIFFSDLDPRTR